MRGNLGWRGLPTAPRRSIPACAGEPRRSLKCRRRSAVYPRLCGGTILRLLRPKDGGGGLSPPVRGNLHSISAMNFQFGSIPACAGEPRKPLPIPARGWVYPRLCGGTSGTSSITGRPYGLSPPVRGNPRLPWHPLLERRSIPACAGEPGRGVAGLGEARVYPRLCGGTGSSASSATPSIGLSPPVRGNLLYPFDRHHTPRSIPACAGEPHGGGIAPARNGVYPRLCGGTIYSAYSGGTAWGLSPPVRGNRLCPAGGKVGTRSIPACAGEPRTLAGVTGRGRVYPRLCGGTSAVACQHVCVSGLSPPVRGNPLRPRRPQAQPRSIPACAGEPAPAIRPAGQKPVYPRLCGGTSLPYHRLPLRHGLSPPVRGNRPRRPPAPGRPGSIPACAGEPAYPRPSGRSSGVYPRLCGGTGVARPIDPHPGGLSPPVRGNPPV